MTTKFKCPRCKKEFKLGRLRASTTCPHCKNGMIITAKEKLLGHKLPKKNFLKIYSIRPDFNKDKKVKIV